MKPVSFEVAKAIKEAGYQQGNEDTAYYNENGMLVKPCVFNGGKEIADAPTYMDVWLWLWREKKSCVGILFDDGNCAIEIWQNKSFIRDLESKFDPEEAIKQAIEYLVENNLIK